MASTWTVMGMEWAVNRTTLAAGALAALLMLTPSVATSQPAARYFLIEANERDVMFLDEASLNRSTDERLLWALIVHRTPRTDGPDGKTYSTSKQLLSLRCSARTWRLTHAASFHDGKAVASQPIASTPAPIVPGTGGEVVFRYACEKPGLSSEEVSLLMTETMAIAASKRPLAGQAR